MKKDSLIILFFGFTFMIFSLVGVYFLYTNSIEMAKESLDSVLYSNIDALNKTYRNNGFEDEFDFLFNSDNNTTYRLESYLTKGVLIDSIKRKDNENWDEWFDNIENVQPNKKYEWVSKLDSKNSYSKLKINGSSYLISYYLTSYGNVSVTILTKIKIWDIIKLNILSYLIMISFALFSIPASIYISWIFNIADRDKRNLKIYQKLADSHLLISITNKDNIIVYANENFLRLAGYTMEELYHKNHNILNNGVKAPWGKMYDMTAEGLIYNNNLIENVTKNKNKYYVDISVTKYPSTGGHLRFSTDLTKLIEQKQEIEKKNLILTRSGYLLRHDMRNPVNMVGKIYKMLNKKLDENHIKELGLTSTFKMLDKSIKNLDIIYNAVYDFTTLADDGLEIKTENVNLTKLLKDYFKLVAYGNCVEVKELGFIETNENLFISAIQNLTKNSYKYNDSEKKEIIIDTDNGNICITDNGLGMSKKQFDEYSKPYIRGSKKTGTGIGLPISILIFKELGYELDIDETYQGKGTRMKLTKL